MSVFAMNYLSFLFFFCHKLFIVPFKTLSNSSKYITLSLVPHFYVDVQYDFYYKVSGFHKLWYVGILELFFIFFLLSG